MCSRLGIDRAPVAGSLLRVAVGKRLLGADSSTVAAAALHGGSRRGGAVGRKGLWQMSCKMVEVTLFDRCHPRWIQLR